MRWPTLYWYLPYSSLSREHSNSNPIYSNNSISNETHIFHSGQLIRRRPSPALPPGKPVQLRADDRRDEVLLRPEVLGSAEERQSTKWIAMANN